MKGNDSVIEREFGEYKGVKDNYPKYVVSLDKINLSSSNLSVGQELIIPTN